MVKKVELKVVLGLEKTLYNTWTFDSEQQANQWLEERIASNAFPEGYAVEAKDITEQYIASMKEEESIQAVVLGSKLIAKIRKMNLEKLESGVWTEEKFMQLISLPVFSQVLSLLQTASYGNRFKSVVNSFDVSFYTPGEKQEILREVIEHQEKYKDFVSY